MAKKTTIQKRIHRWREWVLYLFLLAVTLQIASAILLTAYQANLSVQIQKTQRQISHMQTQNEALSVDIQRLSNYNRIVAMASEEGYRAVNQNVITIFSKND